MRVDPASCPPPKQPGALAPPESRADRLTTAWTAAAPRSKEPRFRVGFLRSDSQGTSRRLVRGSQQLVKSGRHRPALSGVDRLTTLPLLEHPEPPSSKKADVVESLKGFDYVGLLVN